MDALYGLLGIVVGAALGAGGTYFRLRRDAWTEARMNGLILLADVRALIKVESSDPLVTDTQLGVTTWDSRGEALVRFRRGNYPSGLDASDWLKLAGHFAELRKLNRRHGRPSEAAWKAAQKELVEAEELLDCFDFDPSVGPT